MKQNRRTGMVTTRKQTPTEARIAALRSDYAPLYAVAGLTDALTEVFKGALAETQERAGESLSMLQRRSAGAGKLAQENAEDLRTFVITLPDRVDPAFERVQETVTQARKVTTGRTATATMVPRSAAKAAATRKAAAKKAP